MPGVVVQHLGYGDLPQPRLAQPLERLVLGPDQAAGERIDTDLRKPDGLPRAAEYLQYGLAVGAGAAEFDADPHVGRHHRSQVPLDGVRPGRSVHPDLAAQQYPAQAAGQVWVDAPTGADTIE